MLLKAFAFDKKNGIGLTLVFWLIICIFSEQQTQRTPVVEGVVFIRGDLLMASPTRSPLTSRRRLFSCIRSRSRGGGTEPSGLLAAGWRVATETEGRRGGEVRPPFTVRGGM